MKVALTLFLSVVLINAVQANERFVYSFCKNIEKFINNEEFKEKIKIILINNCYRYYKQDYNFCKEFIEVKFNNLINYLRNDYCREYKYDYLTIDDDISCYLNDFNDFNY